MTISFKSRSQEKEIMDLGMPSYEETAETYRLIRAVNRFLGGTRIILMHLERFSRRWEKDSLIRILDVGTGAADIPQAIIHWGRERNRRISVVALDIEADALRFAQGELKDVPEVSWVQASNSNPPFPDHSFDYVISSMFFHHLSNSQIVETLRRFDRLARHGIIVNDLLRRRRAYLWILFFSRFTSNKAFRNDAPLSVLRGFRRPEVEGYIEKTGLDYLKFFYHFGHRFAIAGEKDGAV